MALDRLGGMNDTKLYEQILELHGAVVRAVGNPEEGRGDH